MGQQPQPIAPDRIGIYVHFPWCLKKCPYCDFLSIPGPAGEIPQTAYTSAIIRELSQHRELLGDRPVHSVFFGGGTPSLWHPELVQQVIQTVTTGFRTAGNLEISLECNPGSLTLERAAAFQRAGVNRVSIGVQSLSAERLAFLGRWHTGEQALAAIAAARQAGFQRISADLIYGVQRQPPEQAKRDVEAVLSAGVNHVSAYALTIEPGTRFGEQLRAGKLPLLEESQVADSQLVVHDTLEAAGFEHYEISNFAKPQQEAIHNLGYWTGRDYLGVGTGAWGTLNGVRYRNPSSVERFLNVSHWPAPDPKSAKARRVFSDIEPLSAETRARERLMLGLRLARGVSPRAIERELGVSLLTPKRQADAQRLVERSRLRVEGGRWWIPHRAWLFADDTIARLL